VVIVNVSQWRTEFPILQHRNYLNSCSLGALSHRSVEWVRRFQEEWHAYGASAWYETWMSRLDALRAAAARLVNGDRDEIALTASVSAALASIASCIDYSARKRVVISELDFPTLGYQWMVRPDVEVVRVPSDDGATIDAARFAEAVDERTAVVATSHVYFKTGAIQDLAPVSRIAHDAGALFVVDAYQSAGQVPIDAKAAGADVLITGPLKWLLGGPGIAYLWVRRDRIETLRPTTTGWFGALDQFDFDITNFEFKNDARRFEMGTPALPTVHAALGGHEIIEEAGIAAIRKRNSALTERLIAQAASAGFRVRCAPDAAHRSAIAMLAHDDPGPVVARLADHDIIVDWRPGYVRVSPHFYNTESEVDDVIALMTASPVA
jgi:selenocysteine lyase/cysteine desulfurase